MVENFGVYTQVYGIIADLQNINSMSRAKQARLNNLRMKSRRLRHWCLLSLMILN